MLQERDGQPLEENLLRLLRRSEDHLPRLSPEKKAAMLASLKEKQASLSPSRSPASEAAETALEEQGHSSAGWRAKERADGAGGVRKGVLADAGRAWGALRDAAAAAWTSICWRTGAANPRSAAFLYLQRMKVGLCYSASITVHAVVLLALAGVRIPWLHPAADAETEVQVVGITGQDGLPVDRALIDEIFGPAPASWSKAPDEEARPPSMEHPSMASAVPELARPAVGPAVNDRAQEEMEQLLEEESPVQKSLYAQAPDRVVRPVLGDDLSVVVRGNLSGLALHLGGFGGRRGVSARMRIAALGGGSRETEAAVEAALAFLARMQREDGRWSSAPDGQFESGAAGPADLAVTGLALLAFEGAGHTEIAGKYRRVVQKAVKWLREQQSHDGAWTHGGMMYGHGICTMAMAEAYGMARDRSQALEAAQAGVDYIVRVQGPTGGFGYAGPGGDMSVTGWQILAIKSARVAGLRVPEETVERMKDFLDAMLDPATGVTGYTVRGQGSPAMTAAGLCCRLFLGQNAPEDALVQKVADALSQTGPQVQQEYFLYYGTLGLFQVGGKRWEKWNSGFAASLAGRQVRAGRYAGSWDTKGTQYGGNGGRIYVTCMAALSLEVYYRYLPMFR
ncbi:MAG: terpene cyclase/mutase family protein [Planctomycetes bacterium]|nr:terpene cyclase/mutase family protein [Planctomycetota bacterium]